MMIDDLFSGIPAQLPEELFTTLLEHPGLRIKRIASQGQASPEGFWYDQPQNEWVLLIRGAARLQLEGQEPLELRPGGYLNIPAHVRHRVVWTDPDQTTLWLAVYYN